MPAPTRELRIVIVEDLPTDLALVRRALNQAKIWYTDRHVSKASQFEDALLTFAPDLILSDYNLPGFDGVSALRMAQRLTPDVPFIFVSGAIGEERAAEVLREGATDYIMKDRMQRLGPAVVRAMEEVTARNERLRADAALEKLAAETKLILDSVEEGIVGLDPNGTVTLANPAAAAMLGRSPEEMIGRNFHETVHLALTEAGLLERCGESCALRDASTALRSSEVFWRKDGTSFQVEFTTNAIRGDGRQIGSVVTFRSIEERTLLERQLEQAHRLSSLGRLAATIAHEFNNVLMGILPFNDLIRKSAESEKILQATDRIGRSIQRGKAITGEILRFTRPAAPARQVLTIQPWIDQVAAEIKGVIGESVHIKIESPKGLKVHADPHQLQQVFMNLLVNARDAMPTGGIVSIQVQPPSTRHTYPFGVVQQPQRMVHFIVSDTGSGMTAETIQKIFEPLFTTKRTGTGLGLAVSHQIVQRHDGQIFVESELGKGTTFHIFLPEAVAAS